MFEFNILENFHEKNQEAIDNAERKYILQRKQMNLSYNLADGGSKGPTGFHLSEEAKKKSVKKIV